MIIRVWHKRRPRFSHYCDQTMIKADLEFNNTSRRIDRYHVVNSGKKIIGVSLGKRDFNGTTYEPVVITIESIRF